MIKAAVIGIIAVFLAAPLKKDKQQFATAITICAGIIIIGLAMDKLGDVIYQIKAIERYLGKYSDYIEILLKVIGITYVAEFGSNICKDAGCGAVANQIEFFGKIMIISVSIPVVTSVIELVMDGGI